MPLHCCQRWQAQTTVNWITVYSVVLIREKRCRSFLSCVFSIVWKTMSSCCWGTEVVLSILRLWPAFSSKWLWLQVAGITMLGVTLRDMNSSHRNGRASLPKDICGWQISGQRISVGIRCSVEVCACVFVFLVFFGFFFRTMLKSSQYFLQSSVPLRLFHWLCISAYFSLSNNSHKYTLTVPFGSGLLCIHVFISTKNARHLKFHRQYGNINNSNCALAFRWA